MNKIIIRSQPEGNFEEISIHQANWPDAFLGMVRQGKLIRYNTYTMPNVPDQIQAELAGRGYREFILESDTWERFLVPSAHKLILAGIRPHPESP
jgi:hypothetical protein